MNELLIESVDRAAPLGDDLILGQIFDNALVGICFMAARRFLRVNPQMERMLGYGPGELAGRSVRDVYASMDDFDDVGQILRSFPKNNRYVHERPLVTKSGGTLWCLISGSLIEPGRVGSTSVWIVQDISGRKRAEDQLTRTKHKLEHMVERRTLNLQRMNRVLKQEVERRRASDRSMIESREKYRILIRNSPAGILLTDEDGAIIEINPASTRMFGAADPAHFEAIAARTTVLRERSKRPEVLRIFLGTMVPTKGRKIQNQHVFWADPPHTARWFDVTVVGIPVRGLGAAILFDDKTEERAAKEREHSQREQLAHAGRVALVGQFAAAIAHELGQPLNACQSYAAGIEHKLRDALIQSPEAHDALRRVQRHLEQAGEIIANVRSFVGRRRTTDETVSLSGLIAQTIDLLQMSLHGVDVHYEAKPATGEAMVCGNRIELQQLLVNLILNAVDAMRDARIDAPKIEIRLSVMRSRAMLSVVDNGPGVSAEVAGDIFKPYITTKKGGLGMGLMMCRTIVEAHRGTLSLRASRRRGARFDITLPLAP